MKILLVCAGGMSTSVLMNKMQAYSKQHAIDLTVKAVGLGDYADEAVNGWQCILVGPQVSYYLNTIKEQSKLPTAVIPTMDYALGNADAILKIAQKMING